MVYGRPPFAALTTIQKLHAIPNPKFDIPYPDTGNGHAVDRFVVQGESEGGERRERQGGEIMTGEVPPGPF